LFYTNHHLLADIALSIFAMLFQAFDNGDESIPWSTLRYLIGEAMYGGRVSDSFDRRVLSTYLDEYMGDFLFDKFQPFAFYTSSDRSVCYSIPEDGQKESHIKVRRSIFPSFDDYATRLNLEVIFLRRWLTRCQWNSHLRSSACTPTPTSATTLRLPNHFSTA
jgi:hypothetical protein